MSVPQKMKKSISNISANRKSKTQCSNSSEVNSQNDDVKVNVNNVNTKVYSVTEDIVLIFLDSMMNIIVEDWERISPIDETGLEDLTEPVETASVGVQISDEAFIFVKNQPLNFSFNQKSDENIANKRRESKLKEPVTIKKTSSNHSATKLKAASKTKQATDKKRDSKLSVTEESEESIKIVEWRINKPDEVAKIKFKNGNFYEGSISRLLMDGTGTFVWSDGSKYIGDFKENCATGKGKMTWSDLTWYEGYFKESLRHGSGLYSIAYTTLSYFGEWKVSEKHGKGVMIYGPNNYYDGGWSNDLRCGSGYRFYDNNVKYYGKWKDGLQNGLGICQWPNGDFYYGEWEKGRMNGYGEYTWKAGRNNSFSFPAQNAYHGMWNAGKRNGLGIMYFNIAGGTRLDGCWSKNNKNGPGGMLCANGTLVYAHPLFLNDKPVHITKDNWHPETFGEKVMVLFEKTSKYSKDLSESNTKHCKSSAPNHKELKYFQSPPIDIPMHSGCHDIDLSYHLKQVLKRFSMINLHIDNSLCSQQNINTSPKSSTDLNLSKSELKHNSIASNLKQSESAIPCFQEQYEEKCARNCIQTHLPLLWKIYNNYAEICLDDKKRSQEYSLVRIFLWQLYRNCKLPEKNISLVDIDKMLAENPSSYIDSTHNPFEKIYFFQFLHSLFHIAWKLYAEFAAKNNVRGLLAGAFNTFLCNDVYPNMECHIGKTLFEYRNVVPLQAMYSLYINIDEPLSVRKFLFAIYEKPILTESTKNDENQFSWDGINIITCSETLAYLPHKDPVLGTYKNINKVDMTEPFSGHLYSLTNIGIIEIVKCIASVCPIVSKENLVTNINYEMTFLEFCEVVFACLDREINIKYERIEKERLKEKRLMEMQKEHDENLKAENSKTKKIKKK